MNNGSISAFAFRTGRQIEDLIETHTNNLQGRVRELEGKIMVWWAKDQDKEFAQWFGITDKLDSIDTSSTCKCGNFLTDKEVFYDTCLKCGESIDSE